MKYANTPLEIWVDLRERFGKESAPKAYELKQSLTNTHQEGMFVSGYYTKFQVFGMRFNQLPRPTVHLQ